MALVLTRFAAIIALALPLSGCLYFSDSSTPAPAPVVVQQPPGAAVVVQPQPQ